MNGFLTRNLRLPLSKIVMFKKFIGNSTMYYTNDKLKLVFGLSIYNKSSNSRGVN